MKLKTNPIEVMKALIAAHLKKRTEDDETATMLAIKPMMIESFGAKPAELLLQNRAGLPWIPPECGIGNRPTPPTRPGRFDGILGIFPRSC